VKILLDTNAYSAMRQGEAWAASRVQGAEEVMMSAVVVGELLYGFRNGSRFEQNLEKLEGFLAQPTVKLLPVTWETADLFGRIATALRRKGRPIPTNDIWIAGAGPASDPAEPGGTQALRRAGEALPPPRNFSAFSPVAFPEAKVR